MLFPSRHLLKSSRETCKEIWYLKNFQKIIVTVLTKVLGSCLWYMNTKIKNERKNKKYHADGTVPRFNRKKKTYQTVGTVPRFNRKKKHTTQLKQFQD